MRFRVRNKFVKPQRDTLEEAVRERVSEDTDQSLRKCEHDAMKFFPEGPRDNNEYFWKCKICGVELSVLSWKNDLRLL